jgi:hypothetical protein
MALYWQRTPIQNAAVSNGKDSKKVGDARKPSKAELRDALQAATSEFLHRGGKVTEVPTGTSAWEPGTRPPPGQPLFSQPPAERTPLDHVIAALDSRRAASRQRRKVRRTRKPEPRRRTIYDDFGEPLRRVWTDD